MAKFKSVGERRLTLQACTCALCLAILTYSQPLEDQLSHDIDVNDDLHNETHDEIDNYSSSVKGYNYKRSTTIYGSIRGDIDGRPSLDNVSDVYFSNHVNQDSSDIAPGYQDTDQMYSDNANEYSDTDSSNRLPDYSDSAFDYSDFETEYLNLQPGYDGFEEFNLSTGDYDYDGYQNTNNNDDYNILNITATDRFLNNSHHIYQFPESHHDIEALDNLSEFQRLAHTMAPCRIVIHTPGVAHQLTFWDNTPLHFLSSTRDLKLHDFTEKDIIDITDYISGPGQRCQNKSVSVLFAGEAACVQFDDCQCYDDCVKSADCCADKAMEISLRDGNIRKTLNCVSFSMHISKYHSDISSKATDSTSMVTNCQSSCTDDHIKQLCPVIAISNISQIKPVTSLSSNITYRNIHCARCNGILSDNYVTWGIKVNCKHDLSRGTYRTWDEMWSALVQQYNAGHCVIKLIPPDGGGPLIKSCAPNLVAECHLSTTSFHYTQANIIEDFCSIFYAPISYNCRSYKNVFCAICNGEEFSASAQCLPRENMNDGLQTFPMSVLINWDMMDDEEPDDADPGDCHHTEVKDPFSLSCHQVSCQARHTRVNDTCHHIYSTVSALGYTWTLTLNSRKWIPHSLGSLIAKAYMFRFRKWSKPYTPPLTLSLAMYAIGKEEQKFNDILIHANFSTMREVTIASFENKLQDFLSETFTFKNENYSIQFNSNINTPCEAKKYDQNSRDLTGMHVTLLDDISECNGILCFEEVYYVQFPYEPALSCPFIVFNISLLDVDVTNPKIIIRKGGIKLEIPESSYDLCEDELSVCINALEDVEQNQTIKSDISQFIIQSILSITCTILSLVGLLLTFVTYCIIKRLRTLPGIIIMFITANLFFAQFLFQVGGVSTSHVWLCRVVGILVHYFWLTSFAWMTISAYNMYSAFTNLLKSAHAPGNVISRIFRYVLFANGLPLLIVIANVLRHYLAYGEDNIGYGDRICYISGGAIAKGIFFALPIGIALMINSFCFIRTVQVMHSMSHFNTALRQNRQYSLICTKLSLILGFGWILGFIASAVQTPALWYVFIIVNGSQGLFIFVGYCINKRTFKDYKKLVGRSEKNKKNENPTQTTETITLRSSEHRTTLDTVNEPTSSVDHMTS